jgi:hypothetical protein
MRQKYAAPMKTSCSGLAWPSCLATCLSNAPLRPADQPSIIIKEWEPIFHHACVSIDTFLKILGRLMAQAHQLLIRKLKEHSRRCGGRGSDKFVKSHRSRTWTQ